MKKLAILFFIYFGLQQVCEANSGNREVPAWVKLYLDSKVAAPKNIFLETNAEGNLPIELEHVKIEIFDLDGTRQIKRNLRKPEVLDLTGLAEGAYYVIITDRVKDSLRLLIVE